MNSLDKFNKWAFGKWIEYYSIADKTIVQKLKYYCFNALFCVTISALYVVEEVKDLWKSRK